KNIIVSNVHLAGNRRTNLLIHDESSQVQINNALIHGYPDFNGSTPIGILIKSGGNHGINNATIYNNYHGIYIQDVFSPVSIGSEVFIFNNGSSTSPWSSGIKITGSKHVSVNSSKIYCDQPIGSKTQNFGVFVDSSDSLFIKTK